MDEVVVVVSLDPRAPVAGRIRVSGGDEVTFDGYLELIAALERLRASPAGSDSLRPA